MEKVFVCSLEELPFQKMRHFQIGYKYEIVFYYSNNSVRAFSRGCPFHGWPLDQHGHINGNSISCTHNLTFDLETGSLINFRPNQRGIQVYKVEVKQGSVYVWVPDDYQYEFIN